MKANTARVDIFYGKMSYTKLEEELAFTITDLIGEFTITDLIGGLPKLHYVNFVVNQ